MVDSATHTVPHMQHLNLHSALLCKYTTASQPFRPRQDAMNASSYLHVSGRERVTGKGATHRWSQ